MSDVNNKRLTPLERKAITYKRAYERKQERYDFDIAKYRRHHGLPRVVTGVRPCLRCGQDFCSSDLRSHRMCKDCREWASDQLND